MVSIQTSNVQNKQPWIIDKLEQCKRQKNEPQAIYDAQNAFNHLYSITTQVIEHNYEEQLNFSFW